jgi:DNA end-binding protein Ku
VRRLKQQYIETETNALVPREDGVKGYEIGRYVTVRRKSSTRRLRSKAIPLTSFVARSGGDSVYLDQSYHLAPEGNVGQEAFTDIHEAMRHATNIPMKQMRHQAA